MNNLSISHRHGRTVVRRQANTTRAYGRYRPKAEDFLGSFHAVLARWQNETAFLSDPSAITAHSSYAALVQNAQGATAMIFDELRKQPSLLVWVLDDAFPNERPYDSDKVGNIVEMTKAWLDWGKRRGLNL